MRITALHIYPVKSLQAVSVDTATVESRGFDGDRRWMLVDGSGSFLSQRDHQGLACFSVRMAGKHFEISHPEAPSIVVPRRQPDGPALSVRIWKDTVEAIEGPLKAGRWFSEILGESCRIVFMPDSTARRLDPKYGDSSDAVSFADGYPILLTSRDSLDELNTRLEAPIPMDRFRPNVVLDGGVPWEEELWRTVKLGGVRFRVVKPCPRCVVTTTDQRTGERGIEPLRTLADYRNQNGKVNFGMNLVPDGIGEVSVGSPVELM